MRTDRSNLSGQWTGEFSYPQALVPTTPFVARLEDRGGSLSGTIIEPDMINGGSTVEALVIGVRHGTNVDFTKDYGSRAPSGYEEPVDYVGGISRDGNTVSGVWSLLDLDGTFEMRRDVEIGEEIADEDTVTRPEPVPDR